MQEEIRAFWLLFQLTGGQGRQAFRDYYGVPRRSKVSVGATVGVSCSWWWMKERIPCGPDIQKTGLCVVMSK